MKILAVDDEEYPLRELTEAICGAQPESECVSFSLPSKALHYAEEHPLDAAFLDIELGSTSGIVLAKRLKDLQPAIHIVFVTGYAQYAVDAFSVRAAGYLLKPATAADVQRELAYIGTLRDERPAMDKNAVKVQTFGGFDVLLDGQPLLFKRTKSKELLAYLVDRRGNSVTTKEACAVLFEDGGYDDGRSGYFRSLVSDLRKTLADAGIEDILIRSRNSLAIDSARLDCDAYRFLEGDPAAVNSYRRNYLPQYSWAEFSVGLFEPEL